MDEEDWINQQLGSTPKLIDTRDPAWRAKQGTLKPTPPRSTWRRFVDSLEEAMVRGPAGLFASVTAPLVETGDGKTYEERRKAFAAKERERRQNVDAIDAPDSVGDYVTDIAGGIAGSLVSDPTNLVNPGGSLGRQIVGNAAVGGAADAALQGGEIAAGIRDEYDPLQGGINAAAGPALILGAKGIQKGVDKYRASRTIARGGDLSLDDAVGVGNKFGTVTSTVRSKAKNKQVGGVPNSYHVRGQAIDVARGKGVSHKAIERAYKRAGFDIIESLDEGDHSHFAFRFGKRKGEPVIEDFDFRPPSERSDAIQRPDDLGDIRLVRDELPDVEEMARVNEALLRDADDSDNVIDFNEGAVPIKKKARDAKYAELHKELDDYYWALRHNIDNPLDQNALSLEEINKLKTQMERERYGFPRGGKTHKKYTEVLDAIDELSKRQDPLANRAPPIDSTYDRYTPYVDRPNDPANDTTDMGKQLDDNYWMARTVYDGVRDNLPGAPSREKLKEVVDNIVNASFGVKKNSPEWKVLSDTYELLKDAHNMLLDREIADTKKAVKDVLTPAERQEMDASATRPDIPPVRPAGLGKGSVATTPVNDLREVDTRGKGTQYHGSRGDVPELSEGYYNENNIYGGFDTFYTTDAIDIAKGYGRKRSNQKIYQIRERAPVKFFDMEDRLPEEELHRIFGVKPDDIGLVPAAIEEALKDGRANVREVMDNIRDYSRDEGYSKHDVQEIFDSAIYNLRQEGYGGMSHVGGLKTGRKPHTVKIYFDAPNQLDLTDVRTGASNGPNRNVPPPNPPLPNDPDFPKPGTPGNRGGPKGGADDPVEQRLINDLKQLKPMTGEQRALYREERSRRGSSLSNLQRGDATRENIAQQFGSQRGQLPKKAYQSIAENYSEADFVNLANRINHSPRLLPFQKLNAHKALLNLLGAEGAKLPTPSEIKLLSEVYSEDFVKALLENRTFLQKTWQHTKSGLNVPRAIMSSMDFSAPFRQGIGLVHKKEFWKSIPHMFKMWADTMKGGNADKEWLNSIKSHPRWAAAVEANLGITDPHSHFLAEREEDFMTDWAEKIPGGAGRLIKASNSAYSGFLNKLRWDTFNNLLDQKEAMGDAVDGKTLKQIGKFVNMATGRGDLGKNGNAAAPALSALLFSPRLIASRVKTLFSPVTYMTADPLVRKEAWKSLLAMSAYYLTLGGIAKYGLGMDVETDPRSADFMKAKIGNTRYDFMAGYSQYIRLGAQLLTDKTITGKGVEKDLTSSTGYKDDTRRDVAIRFFLNKLAPVPGLVSDWMEGSDMTGEPFEWKKAITSRMLPMASQDIADAIREWGPVGAAMGLPGLVGWSVQTYEPRAAKPKKEKAADDLFEDDWVKDQVNPEADVDKWLREQGIEP